MNTTTTPPTARRTSRPSIDVADVTGRWGADRRNVDRGQVAKSKIGSFEVGV